MISPVRKVDEIESHLWAIQVPATRENRSYAWKKSASTTPTRWRQKTSDDEKGDVHIPRLKMPDDDEITSKEQERNDWISPLEIPDDDAVLFNVGEVVKSIPPNCKLPYS